ncbi:hypothetical protein I6G82_22005 [Lysinibacillus macroides]|uniref:Uncharacterized protein n=1 Tax=Lysinibacillus macroides TaxID=33935 RepID=A0A0M9DJK5_9BACI|nr:hypothetical protein [Lysinibacillus macroides]KOY81710.1 hypothetical protein ADM90_12340 [Lysinibacillus macroides]QPR67818.1 hypothetical protein I6G82_22005 [Lysinibacillus macroides]
MEKRQSELFQTLKSRPDKEPDRKFSYQLREKLLKKQPQTAKRFTMTTTVTMLVTCVVIIFLVIVSTDQSLKLKQAAQVIDNQGHIFSNVLCIVLMLGVILFIAFVYHKGYTKGKLVYMTFSLSFIVWVGNLIYAEHQPLDDPAMQPSHSDFFDEAHSQLLFLYELDKIKDASVDRFLIGQVPLNEVQEKIKRREGQ